MVALGVALTLMGVAVAAVLARSPLVVAGTNAVPVKIDGSLEKGNIGTCQPLGALPSGTSAIRVAIEAPAAGPEVSMRVLAGSRVLAEGQQPAGWGSAPNVTVPMGGMTDAVGNERICTRIGPIAEHIQIRGMQIRMPPAGSRLSFADMALRMEYLRPGAKSWLSLASSVADHMGLGRAWGGTWIVFLALALAIAVAVLAARLTLTEIAMSKEDPPSSSVPAATGASATSRVREVLLRVPRAAWICALIACLNAACWSILTPPFEVPDEPFHFAYTQQLAENHRLPTSSSYVFSPEENAVMRDVHVYEVHQSPENHTISSVAEQRTLEENLAEHPSRHGDGAVGGAYSSPPLYYMLQTIPYGLASSGTLLDQLQLMRMLSALMAGVSALFVFLFLREALPRARWAWTAGGLSVALAPMLGFMSGAMNPDAMLAAVSAAIFYLLARGFRRGLTPGLAILIGVTIAVGFLTKLTFIGLAPGVILGLVVLTVRSARAHVRSAYRTLAVALAIAVSPVLLYALVNVLSGHAGLGLVSTSLKLGHVHGSIFDKAGYIWQLYLPRLPGMKSYIPGLFTTRQLWFDRFVGFYGWLDTSFPRWVESLALVPAGVLAALCIRTLLAGRSVLRRRLAETVVYGAMSVGLLALIGVSSYYNTSSEGLGFAEPRYLLPLIALFGLGLALAARGAGRRWGPAVGALIVVLFLTHDIFSQLLVVGRYYG